MYYFSTNIILILNLFKPPGLSFNPFHIDRFNLYIGYILTHLELH